MVKLERNANQFFWALSILFLVIFFNFQISAADVGKDPAKFLPDCRSIIAAVSVKELHHLGCPSCGGPTTLEPQPASTDVTPPPAILNAKNNLKWAVPQFQLDGYNESPMYLGYLQCRNCGHFVLPVDQHLLENENNFDHKPSVIETDQEYGLRLIEETSEHRFITFNAPDGLPISMPVIVHPWRTKHHQLDIAEENIEFTHFGDFSEGTILHGRERDFTNGTLTGNRFYALYGRVKTWFEGSRISTFFGSQGAMLKERNGDYSIVVTSSSLTKLNQLAQLVKNNNGKISLDIINQTRDILGGSDTIKNSDLLLPIRKPGKIKFTVSGLPGASNGRQGDSNSGPRFNTSDFGR